MLFIYVVVNLVITRISLNTWSNMRSLISYETALESVGHLSAQRVGRGMYRGEVIRNLALALV